VQFFQASKFNVFCINAFEIQLIYFKIVCKQCSWCIFIVNVRCAQNIFRSRNCYFM